MNNLIIEIEKTGNRFFTESIFTLHKNKFSSYIISGDYLSKAINHYRNERLEVNVLKWFMDFWIYFEIRFVETKNKYPSIFTSLSVFQGDQSDPYKNQLFRADWDNFENTKNHPQPHWHIYPTKYDHKITEDFESYIELHKDSGFEGFLQDQNSQLIDLSKIHFAMSGIWTSNRFKKYIHTIESDQTIINWFSGVLGHIKSQLEYAI